MEKDKFELIKIIQKRIELAESKMQHIDNLLKCCSISARITGTPPQTFMKLDEYHLNNQEYLRKLLADDRINLLTELKDLKEQFAEL